MNIISVKQQYPTFFNYIQADFNTKHDLYHDLDNLETFHLSESNLCEDRFVDVIDFIPETFNSEREEKQMTLFQMAFSDVEDGKVKMKLCQTACEQFEEQSNKITNTKKKRKESVFKQNKKVKSQVTIIQQTYALFKKKQSADTLINISVKERNQIKELCGKFLKSFTNNSTIHF